MRACRRAIRGRLFDGQEAEEAYKDDRKRGSKGEENIEVGKTYYFGELNDDEVNPGELLFSGSIAVWDEETEDWKAVDFKIEESELNEMTT